MPKKKNKKRNQQHRPQNRPPPQRPTGRGGIVTLSQCMIVKNEEQNIEKALSWGKNIVCEQIVVDTGSTDRTTEIAERMGAKVLHFEWINDFGAAKNFAIEQASGDWIAFLDADEYFEAEDAARLLPIINEIQANPNMRDKYLGISCPMLQLDGDKPMEVDVQLRLFRNVPQVRYFGRIHEQLSISIGNICKTGDIKIIHTGYSESAYRDTGKSLRNIEMLRAELEEKPGDATIKAYLAGSLVTAATRGVGGAASGSEPNAATAAVGTTAPGRPQMDSTASLAEEYLIEADQLYKDVIDGGASIEPELKKMAYVHLLSRYRKNPDKASEYEKMSEKAIAELPDEHKIMCFHAQMLNEKGKHAAAFELLKKCEAKYNAATKNTGLHSITDAMLMYTQMATAAQGLGDIENITQYTAVMLMIDKSRVDVLCNYIKLLVKQLPSYDAVWEILSMVYDANSESDRAIIASAATECGATGLAQKALGG